MKFDLKKHSIERFMWVGDPHVKKGNLDESKRLMQWVDKQAQDADVPIIFAGDQYNDFGIARVEAVNFWIDTFASIKSPVIALVGNHDANSDMSENFMDIHSKQALVVNAPVSVAMSNGRIVNLLPFYRKNEDFLSEIHRFQSLKESIIICHQELNGCQYENGFYAPNGVDPNDIPDSVALIIGGHIHKEQRFGKIWYPGTARHLTRSDLGEEKGIFLVDLAKSTNEKILTPPEVSEPFVEVDITPEWEGNPKLLSGTRTFVNITGPAKFVKAMVKKMPAESKYRTFPESEVVEGGVKESEGIPKAFFDFAMNYANQNDIGNAEIKVIIDNIYGKCPVLKGIT